MTSEETVRLSHGRITARWLLPVVRAVGYPGVSQEPAPGGDRGQEQLAADAPALPALGADAGR